MAVLDDFFAKKDKKKKGKKAFSKANTEVLAKNLEENDRKEQQAEEKANDVVQRGPRPIENQSGSQEVSETSRKFHFLHTHLALKNQLEICIDVHFKEI